MSIELHIDDKIIFQTIIEQLTGLHDIFIWYLYSILPNVLIDNDDLLKIVVKQYNLESEIHKLSIKELSHDKIVYKWEKRKQILKELLMKKIMNYIKSLLINKRYKNGIEEFYNNHCSTLPNANKFVFRIIKINNHILQYSDDYSNKRINIAIKTNYRYFKVINGIYYITKGFEKSFYNSPIVDIISIK